MKAAGVLLLAALALFPAASAQQQGTATVEGVVVQSSTGQPLSGATVRLLRSMPLRGAAAQRGAAERSEPSDLEELRPLSATTAQDGRFSFDNVKPAEYRLLAMRGPGYMPAEFGQRSPTGLGISFALAAGQKMAGVQLTLVPTGSIAGRVYDRDGPVGRSQVQALRPIYRDGKRTLTIVQSVLTNDRGEYRLFWLPPGHYFVSAKPITEGTTGAVFISEPTRIGTFEQASSPVVTTRTLPSGEVIDEFQPAVYYPGTTDVNAAGRVDLRVGANADGLDIAITTPPARTRHVRGVALLNGQPAALAGIKAIPRTADPSLTIATARTIADGSFDLAGVAPGAYYLFATTNPGALGGLAIQVGDADLDNLVIPLADGVRVSGRFVVDGRPRGEGGPDMSVLRITLARDPDIMGMPAAGPTYSPPASSDGSFVLDGVPPGDFRVTVRALPPDAYVRSIRMGAVDILDAGLHISGTPRDPLEVIIGGDAGRLAGTVSNSRQEPLANVTVVVVPSQDDRHRRDLYKTATTNQAGRFSIRGLAEGRYTVFAWDQVEDGAWLDPDFLRGHENRGTSIRIRDGADEAVQLTAIQ